MLGTMKGTALGLTQGDTRRLDHSSYSRKPGLHPQPQTRTEPLDKLRSLQAGLPEDREACGLSRLVFGYTTAWIPAAWNYW